MSGRLRFYRRDRMPSKPKSSRPRILMAAYQIRNKSNGGMESATRIFEALRTQFDWSLVTTREMPRTERWRRGGSRVTVTPFDDAKPSWFRRMQGIVWSARLGLEILRFRPSVVHCNDIQSFRALSLLPAWLRRAPLIFTLRDTRPPGNRPGPVWQKLLRHARRIVVLSRDMGARFSDDIPGAEGKIVVINSIVDLESNAPIGHHQRLKTRARLGIQPDEFAVVCIGAVGEKKRQLELVRNIWPLVTRNVPSATLHLLGDCPEDDPYCSSVALAVKTSPSADSVFVRGHIESMPEWYQAADLICINARNEGLARAMIEGMSSGTPVVSTDVCSAREMLEETGAGLVVPRDQPEALAHAICEMTDPDVARIAGRKGRKVAIQRFSQDSVADAWRALYRETAHSNPLDN